MLSEKEREIKGKRERELVNDSMRETKIESERK